MRTQIKLIIIFTIILISNLAEAKTKVYIEKWVEEPKYNMMEQFLYGLTFLLENSWVAGFTDHLETTTLMVNECGMTNEIEPLVGIVIAYHESWGLSEVRAEKTGDTGLMQIKPRYAYKPQNYANFKKAHKKANKAKNLTEKTKLLKKRNDAKAKIYKDKFSIPELKDPETNVHVGCWSLKMWKDEWNGGSAKKGEKTYLAKYAGGSNPHPRAWGFQKWVQKQVAKTKKRLGKKSTWELITDLCVLIYDNFGKRKDSAYLKKFNQKFEIDKNDNSPNFARLFAKMCIMFSAHLQVKIKNYFIIKQNQFVLLTLKLKSKPAKSVYSSNDAFLAQINKYYESEKN